jgi:hypothetical protein
MPTALPAVFVGASIRGREAKATRLRPTVVRRAAQLRRGAKAKIID